MHDAQHVYDLYKVHAAVARQPGYVPDPRLAQKAVSDLEKLHTFQAGKITATQYEEHIAWSAPYRGLLHAVRSHKHAEATAAHAADVLLGPRIKDPPYLGAREEVK